jgi:hypothetical protein
MRRSERSACSFRRGAANASAKFKRLTPQLRPHAVIAARNSRKLQHCSRLPRNTAIMNLVAYSDSESSDSEAAPLSKAVAKSSTKAAPKLVDPGTNKVKVNLSSLIAGASADREAEQDVRPAKRQRTGGGLNINAFLPPPKQPAKQLNNESGFAAKKAAGKGLGSGVNLKTGAEPAFTRSELSSNLDLDGEPKDIKEVIAELRRSRPSASPATTKDDSISIDASTPPMPEVKLVGSAMRFKPKSVALNPAKRKKKNLLGASSVAVAASKVPAVPASQPISNESTKLASAPPPPPPAKSKISLFSISKEELTPTAQPAKNAYDSTLIDDGELAEVPDSAIEDTPTYPPHDDPTPPIHAAPGVDDLNLSQAEMRQLFGRKAGKSGQTPNLSNIKMVNYSADAQYAANEELRAKGETVQHNPVRAIAPGKHSLKQLVNAAATQADALEEHFAQGKRNAREAGSRYGW